MAGITRWLGPPPCAATRTPPSRAASSSRSCTIRSPRSVSTTSTPRAAKDGLSPHSSVSIDFDLTRRVDPAAARISPTIRLCSAASRAQWTTAPFAVASASNRSRCSASAESVCSLMSEAAWRRASHSATCATARSRFSRTCQSAPSCQSVRASSAPKSAARRAWSTGTVASRTVSGTITTGALRRRPASGPRRRGKRGARARHGGRARRGGARTRRRSSRPPRRRGGGGRRDGRGPS